MTVGSLFAGIGGFDLGFTRAGFEIMWQVEIDLQTIDGFAGARAREAARLADPSALYRGADGVPDRLERNRAIGNSVHPAIAEWIARRLLAAEGVTP